MTELAMVDETIVPIDEAKISAHDRSVFFGDGVYEVVRCHGGKLFEMDAHIERFENSLRKMDMLAKVDLNDIRNRVDMAVGKAALSDALVYFHITRGQGPRGHDYDDNWQPGFLLTVRQYHERRHDGKAITHPDWRWKRCDIKSLNLLANVLAKHAATQAGAYEAFLVDDAGLVTEATSSSVMIIKDGALWTTPLTANILPGITRAQLMGWAVEHGLETREESFTPEDVLKADEVLVSGTGTEVLAITHLDDQPIGSGNPGPITLKFEEMLLDAMNA